MRCSEMKRSFAFHGFVFLYSGSYSLRAPAMTFIRRAGSIIADPDNLFSLNTLNVTSVANARYI